MDVRGAPGGSDRRRRYRKHSGAAPDLPLSNRRAVARRARRGLFALLAVVLVCVAGAETAHAQLSPQLRQLQTDLLEIVSDPGWRNAEYGVMAVSLDHGDTLFAVNPDTPIAPASVMKIYTTAAALYYLGEDFRYHTYLLADGPIVDGVLQGNLILYGTGNPGIASRTVGHATSAVHELADSLAALGIRRIEGDIIGDGTYFDQVWLGSGWNADNLLSWFAAPVGALSHGENMISVRVRAGSRAGDPGTITTVPETEGLALVNRVRTVSSGASSVRFSHENNALVVSGQIRTGHPGVVRWATVTDPANYAASVLRSTLERLDISVVGRARAVPERQASPISSRGGVRVNGGSTVLAVHRSIPLSEIVDATNQYSHNLFAEALLKTIGRVVLGEGSFRAGARAVELFLECEAGVPAAALQIVDGSGLSRLNRLSPRTTIHLLDYMTRDPEAEAFYTSLPIAAHAPTRSLRNRMGATPAAGNLRAKTGTIHRVSALAGYVQAANGERIAFAIYGNNVPSTWRMKRMEDAIGIRLARFTRPAPTPVEPEELPEDPIDPEVLDEPEEEPVDPEEVPEVEPEPERPAPRPAPVPVTLLPPEAVTIEVEPDEEPEPEVTHREHTIASGELLGSIARQYGVTVAEIQEANPGLDPRRVRVGQTIRIPVEVPAEAEPEETEEPEEPEEEPEAVARPEPPRPPVEDAAPRRRPAPVPVTLVPPDPREAPDEPEEVEEEEAEPEAPAYREHTVGQGEVLGAIAQRYGVTVAEIQAANPGLDPRRVRAGSTIRIPAATDGETPARRTHTVSAGQNFTTIARQYGVTAAQLQAANPGVDPRRLQLGQELVIP